MLGITLINTLIWQIIPYQDMKEEYPQQYINFYSFQQNAKMSTAERKYFHSNEKPEFATIFNRNKGSQNH